jgi:hypothetical protein
VAQSKATTVEGYLSELPEDRRRLVESVRDVVNANLPDGYEEAMAFGMIGWQIPLDRYPTTYNGQPLMYAGLASQKQYVSLYLMCVYADDGAATDFEQRYRATGKRFDMGKSCVRFRSLDDLPLDLIGETIAATPVEAFIDRYERSRRR